CMERPDAMPCTRAIVKDLLTKESATDILDEVSASFPAVRCHYIGHLLGQELYMSSKNAETALSQCSRQCDASCIHGAIGEAFAETLGLGSPDEEKDFDLEHLSAKEITQLGKSLCTSVDTCHAIGHALFQATKKVPDAFSNCANVAGSDATFSS